MINRRKLLGVVTTGGAALVSMVATHAVAQNPKTSGGSMGSRVNEPGPEAHFLEGRVGLWDVTETIWPAPGATPIKSTGLVAERVMIGSLLQEFLRPPADTARTAVKRTALLCYNRLDGRWDYLSFDTRDPVGMMPAWSLTRGDLNRIELSFAPMAIPGAGAADMGEFLRMRQVMSTTDARHDVNDQYFTLADGTGTEWLAHRYDYVRRT
jgi:hypothetical protein